MTQPASFPDVTRVRLPGSLKAQVHADAQRRGVTVSEVIRDAVTLYVSHPSIKTSEKPQ